MGCFLAIGALFVPRFVIFILWLFSDYMSRAFDTWFWPTLAYAVAQNEFNGFGGIGLVILLVGFAIDLGLLGNGARNRRQHA
jgi:hypothetical protein